jgi:acetyltransferase-like isoleucine patch superfamily enzyme
MVESEVNKLIRLLRRDWPLHFVLLFTNWLPDNVVFLRLRGALAARCLGSCGGNLRVGRNVTFYNPARMHFGRDVYIAQGCWFMAGAQDIVVEDEVMFGPYCVIVTANHTRSNRSFRFAPVTAAPVRIGAGSWLAAHVTVTPTSVVGAGSLIAANSVVVGTLPADALAAGIPAKVLKELT